eukprot:TCONS_00003359-protein
MKKPARDLKLDIINLQKLMHVTRISTQGAKHSSYRQSWTFSYTLQYSDDYEVWHEYKTQNIDGSSSMILPGNRDGTTIASNIVDLRAQYIRLIPKSFKGTYMYLRSCGCPSEMTPFNDVTCQSAPMTK